MESMVPWSPGGRGGRGCVCEGRHGCHGTLSVFGSLGE